VDIGTLLSALNKDMQANALFPGGLGGNRGAPSPINPSSAATDATAAALAAAAAASKGGSTAQASATAAAAALAAARAASSGEGTGPMSAGDAAVAAARAAAANAAALRPVGASGGGVGAGGSAGSGRGGIGAGGVGSGGVGGTGQPGGIGGAGRPGNVGGTGAAGALGGAAGGAQSAAAAAAAEALADVYHASGGAHPSPSLLTQSGVKAYTQLANALSEAGHSEKSAEALTNTLLVASTALKSAYQQALARLPVQLQSRDWGFSVANGTLVFAPGKESLSAQELALLRAAFDEANIEQLANEVADAITTMESKRSTGADMNSLAWGRFRADDNNFDQIVNLRSFLTSSAPGSKYSANIAADDYNSNPESPTSLGSTGSLHPEVPLILGGMYLGDLVTARPDFFRPDIPARTDALDRALEARADARVSTTLHGRCSCGEVSFTLENTLDYAYYCHCSRCRTRTGSAFATIGGASIDKLQVTAGNKSLLIEGECSDGYGARCNRCYAFLFAAVRGRQYVHVSLGVLAGTPSRLPDHHIYVASKAPWYQITDGLPQYDELPLSRR
jgi:hypothetical protein